MTPYFSVIIATYNRSKLLIDTVKSVLDQEYGDFEIVIIDDASTDDTQGVVKKTFTKQLVAKKIRYYRNMKNMERSYSRNLGMSAGKGKYLALLDDDDKWKPDHLSTAVSFLEENDDVGLLLTNFTVYFENGKTESGRKGIKSGKGDMYRDLCMFRELVSGSIYFIRKDVFDTLGGFKEGLEPCEDREYLSRIAMHYNVGYSAKSTVVKYTHSGSFTSKKTLQEHAFNREKTWQAIQENDKNSSYHLKAKVKGKWCLHLASSFLPNSSKSKEYLKKAICLYPLSIFRKTLWRTIARMVYHAIKGTAY